MTEIVGVVRTFATGRGPSSSGTPATASRPGVIAIHAAAMSARLDRAALLSGVDARVVASIHTASTPAAQLLLDITTLSGESDYREAWRRWLLNALTLSGPRSEATVFARALGR